MKISISSLLAAAALTSSLTAAELDRTVLPIQLPPRPVITEMDARKANLPQRVDVKAPTGAPNVLLILLDDLGFGASSVFGGPIPTPTLDQLAENGLRYTHFHTTALCSPTRAALKSGRNHHTCNMGFITEMATGFPGATGMIPNSVAPVAEMLRLNGFSTAAFGKWHETAAWEVSVSGPHTRWPTGPNGGFDKFYGFLGGETNQWAPYLYDGVTPVELPDDPNYHFMADMTEQASKWIKFQKAITPEKPFFIYFAPGAVHAPHHVPNDWIKKWHGKFDQGWDQMREETLKRQLEMGIVPANTQLAPKPKAIQDWDKLNADEKKLFTRQVETFAAYLDYADHHIGQLVKTIEEIGQLENTLIIYVAGDNGTSAEGGMNGMFNEYTYFNQVPEKVSDMLQHLDQWGGPETYPHMAAGWAVALDTPFSWTKQVPSDFGGNRSGMVAFWPKGIQAKNEIRHQFSHVIDVAPTILEATQLPEPKIVNGTPQIPMEGVSLMPTFNDANAEELRKTQYFEIAGNRAIYHDGWFARIIHRAPWEAQPRAQLEEEKWQLYNLKEDYSCINDIAESQPQKVEEMKALFAEEALKYHVYPLDDRVFERLNATAVNRPDILAGRTSMTLSDGMSGIMESNFLNVKNMSKVLTANIELGDQPAEGVIIAQGGRFGGWALHCHDGKPAYTYNFLGLEQTTIMAEQALPAGSEGDKLQLRFEFTNNGTGPGAGGTGKLFVGDKLVAEGEIPRTQAAIFSADETADVGVDLGTPVVAEFKNEHETKFNGQIPKLLVEISKPMPANKPAGE